MATQLIQGTPLLRVLDLDRRDLAPIRELPFQMPIMIGLSRDGRFCYFSAHRGGRLKVFRVSLANLQASEVVDAPAVSAIESHDGNTLLYCTRKGSLGLWRVPVTGGSPERILESVYRRNFAVGADGVYYVAGAEDRAISYYDIKHRTHRTILKTGSPFGWGIDITPDEKTIVYTAMVHEGVDLQIMQLSSRPEH